MIPLSVTDPVSPDIFPEARFFLSFCLNLLVTLIIVRIQYYKMAHRKDYVFMYLVISTMIFFLCYLLENIGLEIGFALGLFAVFGIIRYRTSSLPIKETTFLFVVIGLSVINAMSGQTISYAGALFSSFSAIVIIWTLERPWFQKKDGRKMITYDRPDLLRSGRDTELMNDLRKRTGLDIYRYECSRINHLNDTVKIKVFFRLKFPAR